VDKGRRRIELVEDETGWHALVREAGSNTILWTTDTYEIAAAAEMEARAWIDFHA
jgi:hypothetical protein